MHIFQRKKVDFIKIINFSIDNESQYFASENHFLYWKNGFQKILEVKKVFLATWSRCAIDSPIVLLRKRQKVPKFYLSVFWQKIENHSLCWETFFFSKFLKTHVPMRIWRKIFKHSPVVSGSKGVMFGYVFKRNLCLLIFFNAYQEK